MLKKLKEMEAAQALLSQKLKESNELHILDKAKLEEDMQKEKIMQEERLKKELENLKRNKEDIEKNLKGRRSVAINEHKMPLRLIKIF